jgi:hypothetical protein
VQFSSSKREPARLNTAQLVSEENMFASCSQVIHKAELKRGERREQEKHK